MAAPADVASLIDLTRLLVRTPSASGRDSPERILEAIRGALAADEIAPEILRGPAGEALCLRAHINCGPPGPTYLLNAPADTAAVGDRAAWHHDPFGAEEEDGWLYGRGTADSKAGIAVFCRLAAEIKRRARAMRGGLLLVFDADEHAGTFAGIRRGIEVPNAPPIAGAYIGYPGQDRIIKGCRGFYRVRLRVHGIAAHSGSSTRHGVNAIYRARALIGALEERASALPAARKFPLPPALSVTAVQGGEGFSSVPDLCELHVDCRTTPEFDATWAERLLSSVINEFDRHCPEAAPTDIVRLPGWPAYQLSPQAPILRALSSAAQRVLGQEIPVEVAGPSSIGNYLASRGIEATSGFGVRYRNLHASDECIEVASLEPTYQVYLQALTELMS